MEKTLIESMLSEAGEQKFHLLSPEKAEESLKIFCQEWFNTPQKELNNQIPIDIILKERKELGNTNIAVSYEPGIFTVGSTGDLDELDDKYNYATFLMAKKHRYLKALKIFGEIADQIDCLEEEKYRYFGKVSTCLACLGQVDLAKRYNDLALAHKPDYYIGLQNQKSFQAVELKEDQRQIGMQNLFQSCSEVEPVFNLKINKPAEILKDLLMFLTQVAEVGLSLTSVNKKLTLKDAKNINSKLIKPDEIIQKFSEYEFPIRDVWNLPKVSFLFCLCWAMGLVKLKGQKLTASPKARKFMKKVLMTNFVFCG